MYNYFVINTKLRVMYLIKQSPKFVKFKNLNKKLSIRISYINILELIFIQYTIYIY